MQQRLQSPISIVSSSLFSLSRCAAIFFPSLAVSEPRWDLPCALQGLESEPNGFAVLSSALCHTTTKSTLPLAISNGRHAHKKLTQHAHACKDKLHACFLQRSETQSLRDSPRQKLGTSLRRPRSARPARGNPEQALRPNRGKKKTMLAKRMASRR